jgi:hypothetical protein
MLLFEIEELLRTPTREEIADLKAANGKRDFVEKVGKVLSAARRVSWTGLVNKRFKGSPDLVITKVLLTGNCYGWNSIDRTLLIISTAPT